MNAKYEARLLGRLQRCLDNRRDGRDDGNAFLGALWGMGLSLLLFWLPVGYAIWRLVSR